MKVQKITLEKLAVMVQEGFEGLRNKMEKGFETIHQEISSIKEDIALIKGRLDVMEMEIMNIKKKLDKVAYYHELEALKGRVEMLERKLKVRS